MRITILTAVSNAARTLPDCLASVAGQRLPEGVSSEHLVLDAGSMDGTIGLLDAWAAGALPSPGCDPRQGCVRRYWSEPDGGFYEALNKGIERCTGDIVGILNADDFLHDPEALARVAGSFADPSVQGVYGDLVYVSGGSVPGRVKVTRFWSAGTHTAGSFRWGWMPPHPTVYVRRRVYEVHGGYRCDFGSAADYEWLVRVMVRGGESFRYIPHIQVAMRTGGMSNRSVTARLAANRNDRRAWAVNGLRPLPWTSWLKPLRKIPQWVLGISGRRKSES